MASVSNYLFQDKETERKKQEEKEQRERVEKELKEHVERVLKEVEERERKERQERDLKEHVERVLREVEERERKKCEEIERKEREELERKELEEIQRKEREEREWERVRNDILRLQNEMEVDARAHYLCAEYYGKWKFILFVSLLIFGGALAGFRALFLDWKVPLLGDPWSKKTAIAVFALGAVTFVITAVLKDEMVAKEEDNYPRITKKVLIQLCKDHKLYRTPYLNDVLYLHYKGFAKIENLEEYTGLKCLWLECNGVHKIENLDYQKELRCLYLQQNLISKIENVEHLQQLDTLNVSNNTISKIENIGAIPKLSTLQISHNRLSSADDLRHLSECSNLRNIQLPEKNSTLRVEEGLRYLDDRPVFPRERACAEAWEKGGVEAEREERERWITREQQKIMDSFNAMAKIRERNDLIRKQKQQQITIDDKNDENSLGNSGGGSDESDIEISQDTERQQTQADEKQEPGIVSIDVNTKTADPRNEGDDVCSASVPETPPVQEIETVTIGSSAEYQVLVDHGIFSGSRQHQVKRAGPMITEIVLGEEKRKGEGVLVTELEEDDVETISLPEVPREGSGDFPDSQEDLPELEEIDTKDPFFIRSLNSSHIKTFMFTENDTHVSANIAI
ncbi:Dynein assembly factor 1, axonemal [Stylophora pistillata]|uniref:Dynein assembly factor 1, axonemal n=1 Tax=Stylophora pistillata TaxID=50429 RepID=A0A2B4SBQ6_STYPI|nr:Dynein assembly factor 1, axonemal [Stylophora pistillata]